MARTVNPYAGRYAPVGAIVLCNYWRYVYRVVDHLPNGEVKVEQVESDLTHPQFANEVGRVWTHRTPTDKRDRILYDPTN